MRHITALIFFLSVITCSYGQHKFGIKLYQNTDFFEVTYKDRFGVEETSDQTNFHRFSLALSLQVSNSLTHEIELFIPEVSKPVDRAQFPMNYEFRTDDTFSGEVSTYSLRYELSKTFSKNDSRFTFNIGAGLNPYYVHIEYIPNVSTTYYRSDKFFGVSFNVIPRINFKLTNRLVLDLNIPLKIYDLQWEKTQIKNPSIPIEHQTTKDHDSIFFENVYTIRLGLMYSLK